MNEPAKVDRRPADRSRWRPIAMTALAAPPIALAVAALTGLGLERALSGPAALATALALTLLPVAGLAAGRRGGAPAWAVACWIWCIAVLVMLPVYFPGERASSVRRGLRAATGFAGDGVADAVARAGAGLVTVLGDDPAPIGAARPPATRVASEARTSRPAEAPAATLRADVDDGRPVQLPYEGDQTSLRVRVDVDGPAVGEPLEMIFDTGATFTTLDRATLDRLGVPLEADAPWITLRTANGPIEAPLVLVDAVWLGEEPIEWVTVAVCDTCVNPPAVGLLGLNVTQRFRVSLDHDHRRIELAPRRRAHDRALDVRQWLSIRSLATRYWTGSVGVTLTAANRSHRPIERAIVDLTCGTQTFAVQIDDVPARGERATEITLPRGTDCVQQRIEVSRASWVLDRF